MSIVVYSASLAVIAILIAHPYMRSLARISGLMPLFAGSHPCLNSRDRSTTIRDTSTRPGTRDQGMERNSKYCQ
ncbi:hypothetical protein F4677DRAFT_412707 [Hypoxylon crocopeplum]|nr:hypothetical protein F4677DRAFT_412707 [Hypoxylon crocopeplum]